MFLSILMVEGREILLGTKETQNVCTLKKGCALQATWSFLTFPIFFILLQGIPWELLKVVINLIKLLPYFHISYWLILPTHFEHQPLIQILPENIQ